MATGPNVCVVCHAISFWMFLESEPGKREGRVDIYVLIPSIFRKHRLSPEQGHARSAVYHRTHTHTHEVFNTPKHGENHGNPTC